MMGGFIEVTIVREKGGRVRGLVNVAELIMVAEVPEADRAGLGATMLSQRDGTMFVADEFNDVRTAMTRVGYDVERTP